MDLPSLPARARDSHKGTFGTVAVMGGCIGGRTDKYEVRPRMVGAPALTALAALRGGAGLVKLVMPEPVLTAGLTVCPSATGMPIPVEGGLGPDGTWSHVPPHEASAAVDRAVSGGAGCSVLCVGPGMGSEAWVRAAVLRAMQQEDVPVVLDADGLNALAEIPEIHRDLRAAAVLTPHPGEFDRLAAGLGVGGLKNAASREGACESLARRLGQVIVLKGAATVVSDGQRTWTNTSGHPCLATAGSGDVLSGLIAALIAQFVQSLPLVALLKKPATPERPLDLFEAARVAVWIHGAAGELWAARWQASGGMLASELADLLPGVVERQREVPVDRDVGG